MRKAYANEKYLNGWLRNVRKQNNSSGILDDLDTDPTPPWDDPKTPPDRREGSIITTNEALASAADKVIAPRIQTALNQLETSLDQKIKNAKLELSEAAKEQIRELARESAREMMPPRRIEIYEPKTQQTLDIGLQHERFDILLRACQARLPNGFRPNIWLTGPTGSGKTTAAENVAKALNLDFSADSSLDADYKVIGFRNAQGDLIRTLFRERFEHGGIYLADEIDNWMPSALLSLNSSLANGWCAFPDGMVKRHPDCIIIACANTWGLGATNDYVGRSKLDAASLNRFLPKIDWPVDEKLEHAIAQEMGDVWGWAQLIQRARNSGRAQGLQIIISPRDTFTGIALLKVGFEIRDVIDMTFAAGLKPEQRKAICVDLKPTPNNYEDLHISYINNNRIRMTRIFKEHTKAELQEAKKWVERVTYDRVFPSLEKWIELKDLYA